MDIALHMLGLVYVLGFLHAFDPDHVMTLSTFSSIETDLPRIMRYCINWALGHSLVLLASGALLFGLGLGLPAHLLQASELLVGLVLIGMGLYCIRRLRLDPSGAPGHRQWGLPGAEVTVRHGQANLVHTPVMVGVLHGFAGSATVLALIPAATQGSLLSALVYLLLFSLAVMMAMLVFGLGFGSMQCCINRYSIRLMHGFRYLVAFGSIAVGCYWLTRAW